jgi:hypothetical protein
MDQATIAREAAWRHIEMPETRSRLWTAEHDAAVANYLAEYYAADARTQDSLFNCWASEFKYAMGGDGWALNKIVEQWGDK